MKNILLLFLGTRHSQDAKRNSLKLAVAFPATRGLDWLLVGCTAGLVGLLKKINMPDSLIFVILWAGNMLLSGMVVYIGRKTRTDLTLMEGLRRLIDKTIERSKKIGLLIEAVLFIRLIIWDGADQFIIFFDKRLKTMAVKVAVFVLVSGIQMAIWTALFVKGYESLSQLFS